MQEKVCKNSFYKHNCKQISDDDNSDPDVDDTAFYTFLVSDDVSSTGREILASCVFSDPIPPVSICVAYKIPVFDDLYSHACFAVACHIKIPVCANFSSSDQQMVNVTYSTNVTYSLFRVYIVCCRSEKNRLFNSEI